MFEINDIVAFREWDWEHCQFYPDKWIIIDCEQVHQQYDDYVLEYTIQRCETGEVKSQVTCLQLKPFYD